jgi:hypothetical protein
MKGGGKIMQNIGTSSNAHRLPLTDLIYGIIGLTFLYHKSEGLTRIARDLIYAGVKALTETHSEYFPNVYFTDRGSLSHSKQVEDVLFRLGGVLDIQNPRYQYISFKESELSQVEAKLSKWFTPKNRDIVAKLAEDFYQEVKKDNAGYISARSA